MQATEQNINEMQNKIWYVIRQEDPAGLTSNNSNSSSTNEIYDIKINDIIKLGRVKYAITEIKLNGELRSIDKDVTDPVFNLICDYKYIFNKSRKSIEVNPDVMCKICLSNQEEEGNPMINLCKCSGSISCVHYTCLKTWMQHKLQIKENEKKTVHSYSMKSFNCEICKTPYPRKLVFYLSPVQVRKQLF